MYRPEIPFEIIDAHEFEAALEVLEHLATAFAAGGWDFMSACREANQNTARDQFEFYNNNTNPERERWGNE